MTYRTIIKATIIAHSVIITAFAPALAGTRHHSAEYALGAYDDAWLEAIACKAYGNLRATDRKLGAQYASERKQAHGEALEIMATAKGVAGVKGLHAYCAALVR